MEIGEQLKQCRLTKGYSLEDIEEATKIRARYLEALENEAYDLLPGKVYVIAFLRNYARFLGLDDNELVEQYKSMAQPVNTAVKEEEESQRVIKERPKRRRRRAQPRFFKLLGALAVIAVVFVIASIYNNYAPGPDVPDPPNMVQDKVDDENKNTNDGVKDTVPTPNEKQTQKTVDGVELVLKVTETKCWMRVDVDGKVAFEGTVQAGDSKEFNGSEKINITLGNAGVVDVNYNGENIGKLGPMGQVVNQQFVPKQG